MIRREPFEYEEDEHRDEEVYTPNFDTQPIESQSRRTSTPYDDYDEDDAENAPTLTPAPKWLQFRKTAGNGFESPPAAQNSLTSLTSETSYSPRQLVPLDTYNYNDTMETDSAVDMGSHVTDSQQSTPHARRHLNDSQSTLHSGRHMNLRSGSKTISNATTTAVSNVATRTVSNGVSGTVSNGVNGRAPADVAEEIFARRKVKARRVAKAAWEFVEGPQFEEMVTKKLPTARVDLRELRDFQLKVSRLPSSSDVVVRGMQKLLREQSELMSGLGIMVDGLLVRSEQLRHESQR